MSTEHSVADKSVTSSDGTVIAVEVVGNGPAVVLVSGAFCDRTSTRLLARLLAGQFTVHAYDRRGRGDSGDSGPYAVAREVDDLAAVIDDAEGTPLVYGHSTGAILALEAAAAGLPIARLVAYESMWPLVDPVGANDAIGKHLAELVEQGRPGDATAYFLTDAIGVPAHAVDQMRAAPMWPGMEAFAQTLPYEVAVTGDRSLPTGRLRSVAVPTLALFGTESGDEAREVMTAVASAIPHAECRAMNEQSHAVEQEKLAPILVEYFTVAPR